jgi:uncharacterized membrane protein
MNLSISAIFTLVITVLVAAGLYTSRDWSLQARLFPWTIGIPALGLCFIQLFMDLRKAVRPASQALDDDDQGIMDLKVDKDVAPALVVRRAANIFAWITGLFAAIWLVGFLVSIPLFILFYMRFQSRETWLSSLAWTAVTVGFIIGLFHYILRVPWSYPVIARVQEILLEWI